MKKLNKKLVLNKERIASLENVMGGNDIQSVKILCDITKVRCIDTDYNCGISFPEKCTIASVDYDCITQSEWNSCRCVEY